MGANIGKVLLSCCTKKQKNQKHQKHQNLCLYIISDKENNSMHRCETLAVKNRLACPIHFWHIYNNTIFIS
tara:strand:- start:564 stop:776 length:213 start_codon:yes stop_codon:yes gene_type:complete